MKWKLKESAIAVIKQTNDTHRISNKPNSSNFTTKQTQTINEQKNKKHGRHMIYTSSTIDVIVDVHIRSEGFVTIGRVLQKKEEENNLI